MKKYFYTIISIIFGCFFLLRLYPAGVSAAITSYKITDAFDTAYPDYQNGYVYFYKNITLNYSSGKVYLSGSPDGTGVVTIGDMMQVYDHYLVKKQTYQGYSAGCTVFNDVIPAQDITGLVYPNTYPGTAEQGKNNILVRLSHWCYRQKQIGPLYIVIITEDQPTPTPTQTPTPTPSPTPSATPTPSGPIPFLDLPWEYGKKGLSFSEAVMAMSSYFDHEYPLLGGGTLEPDGLRESVVTYEGPIRTLEPYSSHDGYDFARTAKVLYGDKVLAAAAGVARYVSSCKNCGNMVVIDHGNGYQTRYMHLQKDGLVSTDSAKLTNVSAGDTIGLVGSSGRSSGPHIHFSVYQDKDMDGKFDIPDGATDPMGWSSKAVDPWETYTFDYFGSEKRGNKSYYLWKNPLNRISERVGGAGGTFNAERISVSVPASAVPDLSDLKIESAPAIIRDGSRSLGASFTVEIRDPLGEFVRIFIKPLIITFDFSRFDLAAIKRDTLSIYSSDDGKIWKKEPTVIDPDRHKATAQVNHLSKFALMAERIDTVAPFTTINIEGAKGEDANYRSDVVVSLEVADNDGGLGAEKTLYSLDGEDWTEYTAPIRFVNEGAYEIRYYSWDKDGNQEEARKAVFMIDKSAPEVSVKYDVKQEKISVASSDDTDIKTVSAAGRNRQLLKYTDKAGNYIALLISGQDKERQSIINIHEIRYSGNKVYPINMSYLAVTEKTRSGFVKEMHQKYLLKGEEKLHAEYDFSKNISRITIRSREGVVRESYTGIILLNIETNKGTITYSY